MQKGTGSGLGLSSLVHVAMFGLAIFMGGLIVGYVFGMAKGLKVFANSQVDCR